MDPRVKDITDQRFGMLTVLEFAGVTKGRGAAWKVRCDCGTEKIVRATHLRSGIKSCGPCGLRAGAAARWARPEEREKVRELRRRQWQPSASTDQRREARRRTFAASPAQQAALELGRRRGKNMPAWTPERRAQYVAARAEETRAHVARRQLIADRARASAAAAEARDQAAEQEWRDR